MQSKNQTITDLPNPYESVMITFLVKTRISNDRITKRGFYCPEFKKFMVPPRYSNFNGRLLPDGFGGYNLTVEQVIKWEYPTD